MDAGFPADTGCAHRPSPLSYGVGTPGSVNDCLDYDDGKYNDGEYNEREYSE
jgi:hypothetical protein